MDKVFVLHDLIMITFDAYDGASAIYINDHDVLLFSFPITTIGNLRKINDMFDVSLEHTGYRFYAFANPIKTTVGVTRPITPSHPPVGIFNSAASNIGSLVQYPIILKKIPTEAVIGFVIDLAHVTAIFWIVVISNNNLVTANITVTLSIVSNLSLLRVEYSDETATRLFDKRCKQSFQFDLIAVNNIVNADIYV